MRALNGGVGGGVIGSEGDDGDEAPFALCGTLPLLFDAAGVVELNLTISDAEFDNELAARD